MFLYINKQSGAGCAKRGFSLVEIAIVLAVIGTILGALWIAAQRAWDSTRSEQAREAISTTVSNARAFFGGQVGAPDLDTATLTAQMVTTNVIPSFLKRATNCSGNPCADHPWGSSNGGSLDPAGTFRVCNWTLGTSTSCPSSAPGSPSAFFGVALTGLTKKACITAVQSVSGSIGPPGLVEVNINGVNLLASGKPIQPVSDQDTVTGCASVANGIATVTFVYRVVLPSP